MGKVILIDVSVFCHRAIFSYASVLRLKLTGKLNEKAFVMPPGYIYFSMFISTLKKIGVNSDDLILMAQDGRDSWRKSVYAPYKANRDELREKHTEINWEKCYGEINKINNELKNSLQLAWIQENHIEADDVIAVATDFFKDRECIIVSIDADLQQLCHRPNVKYYSLMAKYKTTKGSYVIVPNPLKIISDKVRKGDVSDNILVDKDNDTEYDVQLRREIIDLFNLPEGVVNIVTNRLEEIPTLKIKEINYKELPFQNSLAQKFDKVFEKDSIINYEDVILYQEKKKERVKKKKMKAKKDKVSLR